MNILLVVGALAIVFGLLTLPPDFDQSNREDEV
jgi:Zn-dependent membrane protease YugP